MVFAEMLSARMNPAVSLFLVLLLIFQSLITALEQRKQYYSGTEYRNPHTNIVLGTQEGVRAVDDAINFLRTQSPLGSSKLVLEDGLSQSARDFCIIQKSMNTSETDEQANERLTRYGDFHGELMQNVAFVSNITSEDLVLEWIIDDGNGPRGRPHRHAIFSAKAHALGIASGPHHVCILVLPSDLLIRLAVLCVLSLLRDTPLEVLNLIMLLLELHINRLLLSTNQLRPLPLPRSSPIFL
jgi:hypothetical protein